MSFILQDEKLLLDLAHSLVKNSQVAPPTELSVAKKLVNRLQREMTGAPEPLNVSSGTADPSDPIGLNVADMQNMAKFLQFLSNNQIQLNGVRIAYSAAEAEARGLSEDIKNKLSPISVSVSRDTATRKWNTADFWANLPLLIQYIHYLQAKADSMEKAGDAQGHVLRVMIGKLIDSVNNYKPDSGLSRAKQKAAPDSPNVVADDVVLDEFNTKTLDIKNPTTDRGTNQIKLYAKDLRSRETLNAWLEGGEGGEAKIVMYDAKGQRSEVSFTDDAADACVAVNVLYRRASRWLQLSKSPEDTKRFTFYVNKIKELGPTFTGADNKPCTIAGVTTTPTTTAPGTAGTGPQVTQFVNRVVSALPLDARDIDFRRIRSFLTLMQGLTSTFPAMQQHISDVNSGMDAIRDATAEETQTFSLSLSPEQFADMFAQKKTPGDQYLPMIIALQRVLNGTRLMLENFYSLYGKYLTEDQKSEVLDQIGSSPTDYSIFRQNSNQLERLRRAVKK